MIRVRLPRAVALSSARRLAACAQSRRAGRREDAGQVRRHARPDDEPLRRQGRTEGVTSTVAVKGDRKATLERHDRPDHRSQRGEDLRPRHEEEDVQGRRRSPSCAARWRRRRRRPTRTRARNRAGAETPAAADRTRRRYEVDFDVKNTGQKKAINGFDTQRGRHDDHGAREGQDARAERRHGADGRHVADADDCGDEGDRRLRQTLRAASCRAGRGRRVGRADGRRAGDVSRA